MTSRPSTVRTPLTGEGCAAAFEARCPADAAPLDRETPWPEADAMRAEPASLQGPLRAIADRLDGISGADFGVATGA